MASDPVQQEPPPRSGRVWLRHDTRGDAELVFDFPLDAELNAAVKTLPGRWFDWRRKHWRVPAEPLTAPGVAEILSRFSELVPEPEVRAWIGDSGRWRAVASVGAQDGDGVFVLRTLSGEPPEGIADGRLPFSAETARRLLDLDGLRLDDAARACAGRLTLGEQPTAAELVLEVGLEGEPELTLQPGYDFGPTTEFKRLPEAHPVERGGRFFNRSLGWAVAVPADPALVPAVDEFLENHGSVVVEEAARDAIAELRAEHERAAETVALSYAEDAELLGVKLGGELHPFQRAGVRYALSRRRTFIADEQGLGKTVQALATLESDGAFPAAVLCPASMKLVWERESRKWLPGRSVEIVEGRTDAGFTPEARTADVVVLNYDILEAHAETLEARGLRALVLDESHYLKNPRARRTKAALALSARLEPDALRLALTGTPVLNRADELTSQLRVLGRLREFGSGARLKRRFRSAGSDDRLHWNLRAHCYVRRTKAQVLPQLPRKRQETVPVALSNERDYRLAERDVIAWLQTLPLDLRTIDAKVAAALRAEQLVRLNQLRQLAAQGKMASALAWIGDFLESGEPLVVFAEHVAAQHAVLERFPEALHILGADSGRRRQDAVDGFQREDGPQLLVGSMKAASQGITLTRASNVAFLELDWTPARHDQAEDRLHRIGQESAVTAWYLLAPDTIDETMAELLERKRALIASVTDGQVRDEESMVDAVARRLRRRPLRHLRVVA